MGYISGEAGDMHVEPEGVLLDAPGCFVGGCARWCVPPTALGSSTALTCCVPTLLADSFAVRNMAWNPRGGCLVLWSTDRMCCCYMDEAIDDGVGDGNGGEGPTRAEEERKDGVSAD